MTPEERRAKGRGSLFQRADGKWVAIVELPRGDDGKRRRKQIVRTSKTAAENAQKVAIREKNAAGDLRTSTPRVDAWVSDWIDAREASGKLRPSTARTYRSYLKAHIAPRIGRHRVDKLTPAHVEHMTAGMVADGVSPTSAVQAQNILKGALKAAMANDLASRNVATLAEPQKKAHYDAETLTAADALRILLLAKSESNIAWARWSLALLAGMRQAEALGVTRQAVDLENGELRVKWQLQQLDNEPPKSLASHHLTGRYWLTEPKSDAGIRVLPLVGALHSALAARLAEMDDDPWALVVTSKSGGPLDHSRDRRNWIDIRDKAGAPPIRLHGARHTVGTLMRAAKVEPRLIQMMLGHSSAAMTEHYSHVGASETALAMESFGKAFAELESRDQ